MARDFKKLFDLQKSKIISKKTNFKPVLLLVPLPTDNIISSFTRFYQEICTKFIVSAMGQSLATFSHKLVFHGLNQEKSRK